MAIEIFDILDADPVTIIMSEEIVKVFARLIDIDESLVNKKALLTKISPVKKEAQREKKESFKIKILLCPLSMKTKV